ncbi:MAG: MarR family winged helix-turn-helix transcriptional regulator [Actinomycetota bacterium]
MSNNEPAVDGPKPGATADGATATGSTATGTDTDDAAAAGRATVDDGTPWLDARQRRAWIGYRRMRTLLDLQLARDLSQASGLSEPDYDVLSTLSEISGSRWRAGDLAARLSWSTSRLTHHTTRMQARGLVAREASAEDGRAAVICLTSAGWAALRAAAPPHVRSVRAHFIDLLTPAEIDALTQISEKVLTRLGLPPNGE